MSELEQIVKWVAKRGCDAGSHKYKFDSFEERYRHLAKIERTALRRLRKLFQKEYNRGYLEHEIDASIERKEDAERREAYND